MTRGQYYGRVVPILALIYVVVIMIANHRGRIAGIGAIVLAIVILAGALFFRPAPGEGRQRNRVRNR